MTTTEKKRHQRQEILKDRHDYRNALIERRNGIDVKISQVEDKIRKIEGK